MAFASLQCSSPLSGAGRPVARAYGRSLATVGLRRRRATEGRGAARHYQPADAQDLSVRVIGELFPVGASSPMGPTLLLACTASVFLNNRFAKLVVTGNTASGCGDLPAARARVEGLEVSQDSTEARVK